ncbi:MAG: hypothetical protein NC923_02990, partial [Candidatus Omnitrophica bacterium]|nr:hypothetical protein [Candidatus Omnitrophota bacterium]
MAKDMRIESETFIMGIYRRWKEARVKSQDLHPDEETLVCFLEERLSADDIERIKKHLVECDICSRLIALNIRIKSVQESSEAPQALLTRIKDKLLREAKSACLEIILLLKDKVMEIINTNGDVLVGQEFMPAPILRSRSIKEFKDEITIVGDFGDISVEARIENKTGGFFDAVIITKQKDTQKFIRDVRLTLIKDNIELESYIAYSGRVKFEHIAAGKYKVEIVSIEKRLAVILLD